MAYPYNPPAPGRRETPPGPGKLWKRIPLDRRIEAAKAFWADDESAEQHVEALVAIASHYRFRVKFVQALTVDKKVRHLASLPALSDAVAGRALVAYHLAHQRPMLATFLDALGMAHDNGILNLDGLKPPADEALDAAAAKIRVSFPAEDVELYFQTLLVQDAETWGGLARHLEAA